METTNNKNTDVTSQRELTRRQKLARRFLPLVLLSGAGSGVAANALHDDAPEPTEVTSVTYTLDEGETPIEAVRASVDSMQIIDEHGNEVKIDGIVSEGQEVSNELQEQSGEDVVHGGDQIKVTVTKSSDGEYELEADPAAKEK